MPLQSPPMALRRARDMPVSWLVCTSLHHPSSSLTRSPALLTATRPVDPALPYRMCLTTRSWAQS